MLSIIIMLFCLCDKEYYIILFRFKKIYNQKLKLINKRNYSQIK